MAALTPLQQLIHDPIAKSDLCTYFDYKSFEGKETPVAVIDMNSVEYEFQIENSVLKIYNKDNLIDPIRTVCLFDKPLLQIANIIDEYGISFKFINAEDALAPAVFLSEFSSVSLESLNVDQSPYDLSLVLTPSCFYARSHILDIDRSVSAIYESNGASQYPVKYWSVYNGQLYTDTHLSTNQLNAIIRVNIKRAYLTIKQRRVLPMHTTFEECFKHSDTIRRAAITYNAKTRNATK